MEKMIEVKSIVENGEFFGTIQTDDGTTSIAKRYNDPKEFGSDLEEVYSELLPLSLEEKIEAKDSASEVVKTSAKATK